MEKYIMVTFPEIQGYMEHERWGECIFCQAIDGHPCPEGTYMVPESLYNKNIPTKIKECIGETFIVGGQEAVLVGCNLEDCEGDYCIVGFRSDGGWTEFNDSDIILSDEKFETYWYVSWEELKESRSE